MILLIIGVPAFQEESWPHATEAQVFGQSPADDEELEALGDAMGWTEWRPLHCPPHWRITDAEAALLTTIPRVDALELTVYHRAWRRHKNETFREPGRKSHKKKSSGRPPGGDWPR